MKKKFDKNIFGLLSNGALHNIITIYMNTFLVAYLLNVSAGNFFNVALYYVISYLVMIVAYTGFSFLICKFNKVYAIRISVFLHCIILISMALLKQDIVTYIVPISIIYNVCNGLYWSALNSLSNETVKGKKLQSYNTYSSVVSNITSIVIPIAFGSIMDSSSISVISVFASIVGFLQICSTFFFEKTRIVHSKLDFKGYYKYCYNGNHKRCFNLLFGGYIAYGCKDAISTLVTMLIVLTFKTNTSLGAISSLISCLTIVILIISNKLYNSKRANIFLYISAITIMSMSLLLININKPSIIFFNICFASLLSIINRAYGVKRSGLIRAIDKKEYIVEHQAITELCLNIGRVIFYSVLLLASFSSEIWVYKTLVAIAMSFVLVYGVIGYILEKEYEKILIEREFKKQIESKQGKLDYLLPCYSNPNHDTILK